MVCPVQGGLRSVGTGGLCAPLHRAGLRQAARPCVSDEPPSQPGRFVSRDAARRELTSAAPCSSHRAKRHGRRRGVRCQGQGRYSYDARTQREASFTLDADGVIFLDVNFTFDAVGTFFDIDCTCAVHEVDVDVTLNMKRKVTLTSKYAVDVKKHDVVTNVKTLPYRAWDTLRIPQHPCLQAAAGI